MVTISLHVLIETQVSKLEVICSLPRKDPQIQNCRIPRKAYPLHVLERDRDNTLSEDISK